MWRWEAVKLRARANEVADPVTRDQLLVFAADCEDEARRRDGDGSDEDKPELVRWHRA